MSDPTRAPAGTQYVAPRSENVPPSQVGSDQAATEVLPTADDGPTIPFVWGSRGSQTSRGSQASDAAQTVPYAAVNANGGSPTAAGNSGAPATTMLPGHPFTEPSNPGPNVVGIIALVVAVVGLVGVVGDEPRGGESRPQDHGRE